MFAQSSARRAATTSSAAPRVSLVTKFFSGPRTALAIVRPPATVSSAPWLTLTPAATIRRPFTVPRLAAGPHAPRLRLRNGHACPRRLAVWRGPTCRSGAASALGFGLTEPDFTTSPGGPCDSPVTGVPGRARAFPSAVWGALRVRHVAVDVATSAFAGEPQPVEIYHRGIWYSGHLLGWRHDTDGRCLARVSCVVGKLKHKAWKDLSDLRLPDTAADSMLARFAEPTTRRIDDLPGPEDDETRPHVLLADLRVRPRKPPHAVAPPPVELKPRADE